MLNLDTHVLVHALAGTCTARERRVLEDDSWGISAIVWWEIAKLVQIGRLTLDLEERDTVKALAAVHVWQLDREIALTSTLLDFKGDPADELIAATSVVHGVPLLTRDRVIRRSKIVPLA